MSSRKDVEKQFKELGTKRIPITFRERAVNIKAFERKLKASIVNERKANMEYMELADEAYKLGLEILSQELRAIATQEGEHFKALAAFETGILWKAKKELYKR